MAAPVKRSSFSRPCSGAFTLIEVLVVIAVVAVLIALLGPQLAKARAQARAAVSASNLRQIGITVELYTHAYRSTYPFGTINTPYPIFVDPESGVWQSWGNQFAFGRVWPVLVRDMAPWNEFASTWISPGSTELEPILQNFGYTYSHSFLARPELWRADALPDPWIVRGVRTDEVVFPSGKVMFWDSALGYELRRVEFLPGMFQNPAPMLLADLHVDTKTPRDAVQPVVNVLNPDPDEGRLPLHNTPDGVRGPDYR